MTQVNLLPTGVREKQKSRAATAAVIATALGAIALLGFVYVLQAARLSSAESKLQNQQAVNQGIQVKISQLSQYSNLKQELATAQSLVKNLKSSEVLWSGILRDVSMVIPDDMWLTSMTGSLNQGTTPVVSGTAPSTAIGTIQFQGFAFEHTTVALWLTRLAEVNGWQNPWLASSTKPAEGDQNVQWTGTVDLGPEATANGGKSTP